jgi:hypothetical protein
MPDPADSARATPPAEPAAARSDAGSAASFTPTQPAGPAPGVEPEPEAKRETLADAIADLLQMAVNYLRQETAGVMRDKVVLPGQQLGKMVAFALAAAFLLAFGLAFVAVALLLLLARYLTWPGALGAIGGALLVGAALFTYLKVRSIQK